MNKIIVANIIKIVSLIITLLVITIPVIDKMFPFSFLAILPITAYIMNKYVKKDKKKIHKYNLLSLFTIIISIMFLSYLLIINIDVLLYGYILETGGLYSLFFSIILVVCLISDIIHNIKQYNNHLIIPVCLLISFIGYRTSTTLNLNGKLFLPEFGIEYYFNHNHIIITTLLFLTLVKGIIELKRLKNKQKSI